MMFVEFANGTQVIAGPMAVAFHYVQKAVHPGMIAVDIGANRGAVTTAMLQRVGPTGHVYAIEPCGATVAIGRAAAPDATWLQYAMGEANGPRTLYLSQDNQHHSCWAPNVLVDCGTELVAGATLDRLQSDGVLPAHIDVVKIDTQGSESAVLLGATRLLRAHATAWILEVWNHGLQAAGSSVDQLLSQLHTADLVPVRYTWAEIRAQALATTDRHGSLDILVRPA